MKGYIFSLDALLAMLLFISSAALLPVLFSLDEQPSTSLISINEANDVVNVLLKNNVFQGMIKQDIQKQLVKLMPKGLKNRVEVKTYTKAGSTFTLSQTVTIGGAVPGNTFVYKGKKFFLTFSGKRISRYGEIDYWVWMP